MLTHTRDRAFALVALVSLGGSCLLAGCASYFQTTYKPATAGHGSLIAPPATPEFRWSLDPDRDGRRLAEQGYVLIGTSRRDYTTDLRFAGDTLSHKERGWERQLCCSTCTVPTSMMIQDVITAPRI